MPSGTLYYFHGNTLGISNTLSSYQLAFIGIDIICNLVFDSTSSDPMIGIQVLTLFINLISVTMMSSHKSIQNIIKSQSTVHTLNTFVMLSYLSLTIPWYVWCLRRTWPAAGDHFNYTFLPKSNTSNSSDTLPFGSGFDHIKESREFYTLWSPGFIALYTCQRTVALLYYGLNLKSILQLANSGRILAVDVSDSHLDVNDRREKELKMRTVSALVEAQARKTELENFDSKEIEEPSQNLKLNQSVEDEESSVSVSHVNPPKPNRKQRFVKEESPYPTDPTSIQESQYSNY